jgi:Methylamine utilisation protein MauE
MKRLVLVGVPVAEIALGISTFARPAVGLALGALLPLVFSAAIVRYYRSLVGAECRCFGNVGTSQIGAFLVVRNLALALVAAGGAVAAWSSGAPSVPPLEVATVGLLALVVFLLMEYRALPKLEGIGGLPSPTEGPSDE